MALPRPRGTISTLALVHARLRARPDRNAFEVQGGPAERKARLTPKAARWRAIQSDAKKLEPLLTLASSRRASPRRQPELTRRSVDDDDYDVKHRAARLGLRARGARSPCRRNGASGAMGARKRVLEFRLRRRLPSFAMLACHRHWTANGGQRPIPKVGRTAERSGASFQLRPRASGRRAASSMECSPWNPRRLPRQGWAGEYDVVALSRNGLSAAIRPFHHPWPSRFRRSPLDLGVSDELMVKSLFNALRPGGFLRPSTTLETKGGVTADRPSGAQPARGGGDFPGHRLRRG